MPVGKKPVFVPYNFFGLVYIYQHRDHISKHAWCTYKRANMHCMDIACTRSFDMGLTSA